MATQRYFVSFHDLTQKKQDLISTPPQQTCFVDVAGLSNDEIREKARERLTKVYGSDCRFEIQFVGVLHGRCFG